MIGRDCNIGDHCYIEGGVTIGDHAVIKNGVSIWQGVTLEDSVFVGPNVAFTNDLLPARRRTGPSTTARWCARASLGANATLVAGITIGRFALVGAGAVVTRDVPGFGLAFGNPARLRGFVCRCGRRLGFGGGRAACSCGREYRHENEQVRELR